MTVAASALIYAMLAWINSTGMITPAWPEDRLVVHVATPQEMAQDMQRCFVKEGYAPPPMEELLAIVPTMAGLYCHNRITLDAELDLDSPTGQTALVHELVHWVQDHNGDADAAECMSEMEYDAYMIHREWQAQMGLTQTPDEFTIVVRSQCEPTME